MKIFKLFLSIIMFISSISANDLPENCICHVCSGGLGQDLFSFSAAYAHAKRLNIPLVLDSDNDNGLLSIMKENFQSISYSKFAHFPIVVGIKSQNGEIIYDYQHSRYNQSNLTYYSNGAYGYYLSLKWFENEFEEIKSMILPPKKTIETINNKYGRYLYYPIKVGIHIRTFKPDSVENYHLLWKQPTTQYFEKAFALFPDDALFFVASDNIPFAKEILSPFDKKLIFLNDSGSDEIEKFTGNSTTLEEFFLLTMCDHLIGGNSTFSIWAAILNKNPNKIIVLPDNINPNKKCIVEEKWNLIPY